MVVLFRLVVIPFFLVAVEQFKLQLSYFLLIFGLAPAFFRSAWASVIFSVCSIVEVLIRSE